jgi:hypothetical protein
MRLTRATVSCSQAVQLKGAVNDKLIHQQYLITLQFARYGSIPSAFAWAYIHRASRLIGVLLEIRSGVHSRAGRWLSHLHLEGDECGLLRRGGSRLNLVNSTRRPSAAAADSATSATSANRPRVRPRVAAAATMGECSAAQLLFRVYRES